jgi:hypothetical protein
MLLPYRKVSIQAETGVEFILSSLYSRGWTLEGKPKIPSWTARCRTKNTHFSRRRRQSGAFSTSRTSRRRLLQDLININVHLHVRFLLNFRSNIMCSFKPSLTHFACIIFFRIGIEWAFVAILYHEEKRSVRVSVEIKDTFRQQLTKDVRRVCTQRFDNSACNPKQLDDKRSTAWLHNCR